MFPTLIMLLINPLTEYPSQGELFMAKNRDYLFRANHTTILTRVQFVLWQQANAKIYNMKKNVFWRW